MKRTIFSTIDEYIQSFPEDVQQILQKIRKTIKEIIPEAEETISYAIPTVKLNGKYVIYFAAFKDHISLYPLPPGTDTFKKEITPYIKGKGTLSFPLSKPIPYDLVKEVTKFSLKENLARTKQK